MTTRKLENQYRFFALAKFETRARLGENSAKNDHFFTV